MKKIVAMLITFIFAGSSFAADIDLGEGWHVQDGFDKILITSSDGTAIQNAVDHIKDDGTIELSGNFKLKRTINIKKNLTIKGKDNNKAVLDGTATKNRVIRCQGNITLENLTIMNGNSTNGGGVKLDGGKVKIISCDITGNQGLLGGGGIHSQADELELTNCNISRNSSSLTGGGISAINGTITMTSCDIRNNDAQLYGGGVVALGSTITMTKCTITANNANQGKGGGVAFIKLKANPTSNDCKIVDNTATENLNIHIEQ